MSIIVRRKTCRKKELRPPQIPQNLNMERNSPSNMVAYENAPIVQSLSILTIILSYTMSSSSSIYLDAEMTFEHIQLWRVVTSQLIFRNTMQAIVGLILLYSCREFERQMGSKKFAAFLVFSYFATIILLLSITTLSYLFGFYYIPSPGPFFVIYSLIAFYYFHIPRVGSARTQYSLLGMSK